MPGKCHLDYCAHGVGVRKPDVVKKTTSQKSVRQLLLVIRGDDNDRPSPRFHRLACFVDKELHTIEFLQQVVRKFDVGLVDLINQQYRAFVGKTKASHNLPRLM